MSITEALLRIRGSITTLADTLSLVPTPRLIAVSKTKPVALLMEAYEAGQRDFGENYVNEIVEKAPLMPKDVRWHFIGHLQSNKCGNILISRFLFLILTIHNIIIIHLTLISIIYYVYIYMLSNLFLQSFC